MKKRLYNETGRLTLPAEKIIKEYWDFTQKFINEHKDTYDIRDLESMMINTVSDNIVNTILGL